MLAPLPLAPAAAAGLYRLVVTGSLTLDVGVGRRTRPLGPLSIDVAAPRDVVFDVIAAPYLGRAGRQASEKIEILDRGSDMVVAAHRTPAGSLVATTVESVRFERPGRVHFRLLRGPVPHVVETFDLEEENGTTRLSYRGELGTDFWAAGAAWGALVSRKWEEAVAKSFADIRERSEQKAAAHERRAHRGN